MVVHLAPRLRAVDGPPAAASSSGRPTDDGCLVGESVVQLVVDDAPAVTGNTLWDAFAAPAAPDALVAHDDDDDADMDEPHAAGGRKKKDTRLRHEKPRTTRLNYYVCTRTGCGWSGKMPRMHMRSRPKCPSFPCTMHYEKGSGVTAAVAAFLSQCTARQRELGLAPDGARPVPMAGADGAIDPNVLYLTVPRGLTAGDVFRVASRHNSYATVTVPEGRVEGDVISISSTHQ